jgi:hypothetical protein
VQDDETENQTVSLEVSHMFHNFFDNYIEDEACLLLDKKWSICTIKVLDGDGVLELDKNLKSIKFLLELEVTIVEHLEEIPRDYQLKQVTYEVCNLAHTNTFQSDIYVKGYSFES